MNQTTPTVTDAAAKQAAALTLGIVDGAVFKHASVFRPTPAGGSFAMTVGSAIGAAGASGAGIGGSLTAGAAVVTAKVAAAAAIGAAAAPFLLAAGAGYGLYRLFKKK